MLRRFEAYALDSAAAGQAVRRLAEACRCCGRRIGEVQHCAIGWNRSAAPVQLVWEHAYASPEAYRRYMVHPYHAAVLDRFILHDSPERVVTPDTVGAGLFGYHVETPRFVLHGGVRRIVLLRCERHAPEAVIGDLLRRLEDACAEAPGMTVSVAAANTVGPAWFDGVTPMAGPPRWTHLWEQGFDSEDSLESYRGGGSALAEVERQGTSGWAQISRGVVTRVLDIHYEIEPAPSGSSDAEPARTG